MNLFRLSPNLFALLVFSVGIVAIRYISYEAPEKHGFKREHIRVAEQLEVLELPYNSYYINGLSNQRIFLGNYTAPRVLFSCSYTLMDTLTEKIPFTFNEHINWKLAKMQVDSPAVYLAEYKTPSFVSAELPFKNEKTHHLQDMYLDLVHVLSANSLIVNGYHPLLKQNALQKITPDSTTTSTQFYQHKLQQHSNFSIDGFLSYNKKQGRIIFTYYYRNQFVCLDTNLCVLYKGKTIDTNTLAKIAVAEIEKDGQKIRTMKKPALTVNSKGYCDSGYIYNEAALIGENEDPDFFREHVVLDVYRLDNGKFDHSLYLPRYKDEMLRDFAVNGNILIALYGQYLVTYLLK